MGEHELLCHLGSLKGCIWLTVNPGQLTWLSIKSTHFRAASTRSSVTPPPKVPFRGTRKVWMLLDLQKPTVTISSRLWWTANSWDKPLMRLKYTVAVGNAWAKSIWSDNSGSLLITVGDEMDVDNVDNEGQQDGPAGDKPVWKASQVYSISRYSMLWLLRQRRFKNC